MKRTLAVLYRHDHRQHDEDVAINPPGNDNLSGKVDVKDVNRLYKHVQGNINIWTPLEQS